eukprot:99297-Hanusia_phi.AAC.1
MAGAVDRSCSSLNSDQDAVMSPYDGGHSLAGCLGCKHSKESAGELAATLLLCRCVIIRQSVGKRKLEASHNAETVRKWTAACPPFCSFPANLKFPPEHHASNEHSLTRSPISSVSVSISSPPPETLTSQKLHYQTLTFIHTSMGIKHKYITSLCRALPDGLTAMQGTRSSAGRSSEAPGLPGSPCRMT